MKNILGIYHYSKLQLLKNNLFGKAPLKQFIILTKHIKKIIVFCIEHSLHYKNFRENFWLFLKLIFSLFTFLFFSSFQLDIIGFKKET